MKFRLALLVTALVPAPVAANYCAAPLSRTNATISGIVNTYYPVIADIQNGDQLQVGAAFGANEALRVGDLVLLWIPQSMQYATPSSPTTSGHNTTQFGDGTTGNGWTFINNTGKFQWLRVSGSGGGTSPTGTVVKPAGDSGNTTLTLTNGGGQGLFGQLQLTGQTTLRSAQLIRVPQYGNVTISGTVTAEPYRQTVNSGTTGPRGIGGIVALDVAGTTTFAPGSKIDVSGLGFRGGAGQRLDGIATPAINMVNATKWYAHPGLLRPTGGIKGEGGAGTPHRLFYQGAETPNLDYTGTGSISNEGYGTSSGGGAAYGRGAPGNGGGGATDQCPYNTNSGISTTADTMCRINTVTYGYSRLNTGGGGGGGAGSGGKGGDHDYDGTGPGVANGGGFGGVGVASFTQYDATAPVPTGNHQYAMLGGGGGAGSTNAAGTDDLQSSGATGGGVVLIRTGKVAGSGSILADGNSAQDVTAVDPANGGGTGAGQGNGGGGGGGGGWILVGARQSSSPSLTYSAKGGKGGNANKCMGAGGGGGGGYVGVSTAMPAASALSVTGGSAGTSSCNLAVDLPRATSLRVDWDPTGPYAATAGTNGSTGQFPASGLSAPSPNAAGGQGPASSSSVAPGPQCVPILSKEFSIDGGNTWLPSINASNNQLFKMRIGIENGNEDNFLAPGGSTLPQLYEDIAFVDTYPANIINATPPNVQQSGCGAAGFTATAGGNTLAVSSSGSIQGLSTCRVTVDLRVTATGTHTNTMAAESVSVVQLKQVTPGNVLTLKNYENVAASVVVPAGVSASKTSAVVSDPINNTTNPKRIPGASVDYTIAITNSSGSTLDNNTMIMSDTLPTTTRMFVGNLNAGAPFQFTAGTSTLTCAFTSLSDANDCIDFSNDGGATWTYTPTPAGDGTDAAVRAIRFRTSGSMPTGTNMSVRYRVVVK